VQTRARALDNNLYVIAPNVGTYYLTVDSDTPIDTFGGGSIIVDHQGRVVGRHAYSGVSSWVAGTVDIEALRRFRVNSKWGNWMKDLTVEQYRVIYEEPVYPANLYLERAPYTHDSYAAEVLRPAIDRLVERGVYARPSEPGIEREPAGIAGLGGVPVPDLGLVDLPAEVDLPPVAQGGEVDQAGLEVPDE
jgi:hypothetical protein